MSTTAIHETAIVSKDADLDPSVVVGPYAVVEDNVRIGAGTVLGPHAVVRQFSRIGKNNVIDPGAVIGGLPQHAGYDGAETWVVIGDGNIIREGATINRAYTPGGETRVGSNCFFMTGTHVGHDCRIGDNVVMTTGVILAGHVEVGSNAVFGGYAGAHQFIRIGAYCMVAGYAALRKDVIPFTMIGGEPLRHFKLNTIGLRRAGMEKDRYRALETAFRAVRDGDKELSSLPDTEEIVRLRDWLSRKSKYGCYGFARPGRK